MSLLPLMFRVEEKRAAVIGAGAVAARHIPKLIEAGLNEIVVYAPSLHESLKPSLKKGHFKWCQGEVIDHLLFEEDILLLTTNNSTLHLAICEKRRPEQLVYMADHPELSDFHFPMTLSKGPLTIAISTRGASPTYGKELMNQLESFIGDTVEEDLLFLEGARKKVMESGLDDRGRRTILKRIATRAFLQEHERERLLVQLILKEKNRLR
jgi:precorrin-2 dehydrogenase/sirohydrochlorin ferrochelatase